MKCLLFASSFSFTVVAELGSNAIVQQENAPKCFHELVACASDLFESLKVDYYLDKDLLLGQQRNGKFVPWSPNLDMSVLDDGIPAVKTLLGSSFTSKKAAVPSCANVLYFTEHPSYHGRYRMVHSCPHVLHPVGQQTLDIEKSLRSASKPTKECFISEVKSRCPGAADQLLVTQYGPDWKTPKYLQWNGHSWLTSQELDAEAGKAVGGVVNRLHPKARYGKIDDPTVLEDHVKNVTLQQRERDTKEAMSMMGGSDESEAALASARAKQQRAEASQRTTKAQQRAKYLLDLLAWKRREQDMKRQQAGLPPLDHSTDSSDLEKDLTTTSKGGAGGVAAAEALVAKAEKQLDAPAAPAAPAVPPTAPTTAPKVGSDQPVDAVKPPSPKVQALEELTAAASADTSAVGAATGAAGATGGALSSIASTMFSSGAENDATAAL